MGSVDLFISYSHKDRDLVKPLADLLGLPGEAIFWDEQSLKPGQLWSSEIDRAIASCRIVVLCWCCDTASSQYVEHEVDLALRHKKILVPVRLCDMTPPQVIAQRQWIDLSGKIKHHCDRGAHVAASGCAPGCFDAAGAMAGTRAAGWIVATLLAMLLIATTRHTLLDLLRLAAQGLRALYRSAPLILPALALICLVAFAFFLAWRQRKRQRLSRLDAKLEHEVRSYFENQVAA